MRQAAEKSQPWGPEQKLSWFLRQKHQRSYKMDVLKRIEALRSKNDPSVKIEEYGRLTVNPELYPVFAFRIGDQSKSKPNVLITGGVHGYETSGVKGALLFIEKYASKYTAHFNFVVTPCISPWSYETINRLDPIMENPNREFKDGGKAEESRFLMAYLAKLGIEFDAHIDLHETTDSDKVFIPEEYSKNGLVIPSDDVDIPDGFYLIGVEGYEKADLEKSMIDSVRKVTHIAEPDEKGEILGTKLSMDGMVHTTIPGLCAQYTSAVSRLGAFTTEMYPDSPRYKHLGTEGVEAMCNEAQVACVIGALDFLKSKS